MKADYDLEILTAIEEGRHDFNGIYEQVKQINTSKTKFSDHIKTLKKLGIIKMTIKNNRNYYSVKEDWNFGFFLEHIEAIKNETINLKKDTKKYSNKKLLQFSVEHITEYLNQLGVAAFLKTTETQKRECIKELRNSCDTMMDILEKRDPKLAKICYEAVLTKLPGLHEL